MDEARKAQGLSANEQAGSVPRRSFRRVSRREKFVRDFLRRGAATAAQRTTHAA